MAIEIIKFSNGKFGARKPRRLYPNDTQFEYLSTNELDWYSIARYIREHCMFETQKQARRAAAGHDSSTDTVLETLGK